MRQLAQHRPMSLQVILITMPGWVVSVEEHVLHAQFLKLADVGGDLFKCAVTGEPALRR